MIKYFVAQWTGTHCGYNLSLDNMRPEQASEFHDDCGKPQFTSPSGITCKAGHGGAPSIEERQEATPKPKAPGGAPFSLGSYTAAVVRKAPNSLEETLFSREGQLKPFVPPHLAGPFTTPELSAEVTRGYGLTIPGPRNSYMAARIDGSIKFPAEPTADGIRTTWVWLGELLTELMEPEIAKTTTMLAKLAQR